MSDPTEITWIESNYSQYVIFGCGVLAIVWGAVNAMFVKNVQLDSEKIYPNTNEDDKKDEAYAAMMPWTSEGCRERMEEINVMIKEGAITFLKKEYLALTIYCTFFSLVIMAAVDMPWAEGYQSVPFTMISFIVGAATSMLCGYIGMKIATDANVKVTYLCNTDINDGFIVAFQGGEVLGFCLVGISIVILEILILIYKASLAPGTLRETEYLFEAISGYGLGGSTVALFGRVGGGIYTKAADVGADLAGKVDGALPEDSPKNPGTIADNVGDNV